METPVKCSEDMRMGRHDHVLPTLLFFAPS